MQASETMTIFILFHQSNHRDFKNDYKGFVAQFYADAFPQMLSDMRFLEIIPTLLVPLCCYFAYLKGKPTGIAFVDPTSLKVCYHLHIPRECVFDGIAKRGRGTMDGFMASICISSSTIKAIFWWLK